MSEDTDDLAARASLIDEAEFANSSLVRLLAKRDEALRLAKLAIDGAEPWVESGPAGAWRDGVLQRITTALAAIDALRE